VADAARTVPGPEDEPPCWGQPACLRTPCSAKLRCVRDTPAARDTRDTRAARTSALSSPAPVICLDERQHALQQRALYEQRHPQDAVAAAERGRLCNVGAARTGAGSGMGHHAGAAEAPDMQDACMPCSQHTCIARAR